MRQFTVYAPAKLNLYLDVLDKRPDGYHNIETLFEKIDLKDEIIVKEKAKGIDVRVENSGMCPSGKDNIVYKALQALFKEAGRDLGLEIVIRKNIPVSAGLGGGSSDAAAVLRSVNAMFGLGVSSERLFSIAAETGKDVPFFLLEQSFAIGKGTGEVLEPVDTDCSFSHLIVRPDIPISTKEMYKRLGDCAKRPKKGGLEKSVSAIKKKDLSLLEKAYYNIFEDILFDYSEYVDRARALLLDAGARPCFLSGSGPSVFCIFKDREGAMKTLNRIPKGEGAEVFFAETFKGGHLWR